MKILFKLWKFPGVSETFILAQIATAIKAGFKVEILINDFPEVLENNIHDNFIREYKIKEKVIFERLQIPQNRNFRILKAVWLLVLNFKYLNKIFKYLKLKKFRDLNHIFQFHFYKKFQNHDLIHIEYGTNARPVDSLKKIGLIKSKIIVSFHGHDLHFPINGRLHNSGYYDELFNTANFLICNTPFLESKLLELGPPQHKIRVIPVAVDTDIFRPIKKKKVRKRLRLISVGRLDELKGQKFGIEAMKILIQRGYDLEYHILGDGKTADNLKTLTKTYNLHDRVVFHGIADQSKVLKYLQESDIFLLTSITNSNGMAESQGLVTAEAQACGLPVIAFDSGGVKYTIIEGETGFLSKEKDIQFYVEKIELLINDNELRTLMGQRAVEFIEANYSKKSVLKKWKEIYS